MNSPNYIAVDKETAKVLLEWLEHEFVPHDDRYLIISNFVKRLRVFVENSDDMAK